MTLAAWFAEMARNHVWSSVRLYEACARLSASDVSAARTSFFPAIDRTLWHVALVDGFYLDALTRGGRGAAIFDDHDAPPSFEAIRAAQRGFDRALLAYVATLDDPKLESLSFVDRGPRGVFPDRVGDLLLHVFQHAIHHRGQVHAMLSGTTVKPPQLDEFFLRDERPLAERELAEAGFPLI